MAFRGLRDDVDSASRNATEGIFHRHLIPVRVKYIERSAIGATAGRVVTTIQT